MTLTSSPVSSTELSILLSRARAAGPEGAIARADLVKRFLPLVRPIAHHVGASRPDLREDLEQVGSIGLLHAIERCDPDRADRFETYANHLIAGEIRHYLRDYAPLVRPPRELVELRPKVLTAQARMAQQLEGQPTPEALATVLGVPVDKIEEVLALEVGTSPVSIDQEMETERGASRPQWVDQRYKSFQLATEDRLMLTEALGKLRAVSREVIEFAFYEDLTQTEIAKKLGISQMQVSRRLKSAVGELFKVCHGKLF